VQAALQPDHDFFLDTSIVDFAAPSELWDILLAGGNAYLIPSVVDELTPWLERHPDHPMSAPVLQKSPRLQFVTSRDFTPSVWDGIHFYLNLLVRRKQVMRTTEMRLGREIGRHPTIDEVQQEVQRTLGERAYLIGRKMKNAKLEELSHADEGLVTIAFARAVRTGRPTTILTRDQDVVEQLYKLTVLIDFDYRSMLLANSYLHDFGLYRPQPLALDEVWLREAFVDDPNNVQFERQPGLEESILPSSFDFVAVSCIRVSDAITHLSFGAEKRMEETLEVKGRTGGLNTDKLGTRNCHLSLWPLSVSKPRQTIAVIAVDKRVRLGDRFTIGLLDINRAMSTNDPTDTIYAPRWAKRPPPRATPRARRRAPSLIRPRGPGVAERAPFRGMDTR